MEHKKNSRYLVLSSLLGVSGGLLLMYSPLWDWCESVVYCETSFLDEVLAQPLFLFSLSVLICSGILFFLREEIFRSWTRFAKWYLLVSAGVLLFGSFDGGGYISMGLDDRESVTWFLAGFFLFISLVLIVWKWFTLRGKK